MAEQLKEIEIPFGAKDSELCGWEYSIPEGMEATIVDNKIVVKKKESGDERIKGLIYLSIEKGMGIPSVEDRKKALAWLKKQGEQKPVLDNALKEAFDKSRKDYSLEEKKEASDYSESIIPTSIACGESEEEYMLHKIIEAAYITGKNSMQNPAWSEEDEDMLQSILDEYKSMTTEKRNWLKSIKDIVQPQTKQEWSEEDEEFLSEIISDIKSAQYKHPDSQMNQIIIDEEVTWLKSLKERYTWKPSDEQMKVLSKYAEQNNYDGSVLTSLYQELKKLRRE